MKIKPSGSGGARTLFRPPPFLSHSLSLYLTHSIYLSLRTVLPPARSRSRQHTWRRQTDDKRVARAGRQSQYFQKASAEALKATGRVRFFYTPARVERVENMDSIKTRTDLFPSLKRGR